MKIKSFKDKILIILSVFSVLLILAICFAVGGYYRATKLTEYGSYAYDYAKAAAEYIDGDTVLNYAETLKKDEYYEDIMRYLNAAQRNSNVMYYYVFIPCEDDLMYIWDADTIEGACELGEHENYITGGKDISMAAMNGDVVQRLDFSTSDIYGRIASVYYPIYNSAGKSVALVGVDFSVPDIESSLVSFLIIIVMISVLVIIAFIVIMYFIFNRSFVRPVKLLNESAKNMVSNIETDSVIDISIKTGDEIEELSNSFEQMYREIKDYIARLYTVTAEKERIGAELGVAANIQANMLPCIFPAFPDRKEFDIYATMLPAKEVGGDFYDYFMIDPDHLAVVMADVSGKGVPAALFMVIAKTLIKNRAQLSAGQAENCSPAQILTDVNDRLCEGNKAELFVTVWLCVLEISTGKCVACNAGHEYPAIKRKGGGFEIYKTRNSPAVAAMEGVKFREYEFTLSPGDTLFTYTDGVAEATNAENELFGTYRMLSALDSSPEGSLEGLLGTVKARIDDFVGNAPQFDDITMLGLTYFGG